MKNFYLLFNLILFYPLVNLAQEKTSQYYMAFSQKVDVSAYSSKRLKLSADLKVVSKDDEAKSYLWFSGVLENGEEGKFFSFENNEGVAPKEWSNFSIINKVEENITYLNLGGLVLYDGNFLFDNFRLEVEESAGVWTEIPLKNNGFEQSISETSIEEWSLGFGKEEFLVKQFTISSSPDSPTEGGQSLSLTGKNTKLKKEDSEFVEVYSEAINDNDEPLIIENVNFIDVISGVIKKGTIQVENGLITSVKTEGNSAKGAIRIDGTEKWLIPGLVDSHIHLFQSGGAYTRPDVFDLTEYRRYEEERKWVKRNATDLLKRYLKAGITSVIDMGGPMYNLALRDSLSDGKTYPNIFLTGPLISTYQPKAFEIKNPPIIKTKTVEEAKEIIDEQQELKTDFIKIWYIASNEEEANSNYNLVKGTIDESHKNNLKVAVHATELFTAKLALKAGADILVHSIDDPIDNEFIELLQKNEVTYIPTLIVGKKYVETFAQKLPFTDWDFEIANPETLGSLQDLGHINDEIVNNYKNYGEKTLMEPQVDEINNLKNLKYLSSIVINIATGTDAGNIGTLHASSYSEEVEKMKEAGMTNIEILKASTINGAKVLGMQDKFGSISKGKWADLVLLNKNPLDDLSAIKDIAMVIKGGRAYNAENILHDTPEQLVQRQLNAYNAKNIEAFLEVYSEDLELYTFPNELNDKGKENIRPTYEELFDKNPDLHCELVNRIINGNTVIDHERITTKKGGASFDATAIYKIKNGKISKVYFVRD